MRYTVSMQESHYEALTAHLFPDRKAERAAYLLCSLSTSAEEKRLLVQEVIPVAAEHIDDSSDRHMTIDQPSYLRALKMAARSHRCFVFAHSHPSGYTSHSPQDDKTELPLFRTAYVRIHNQEAVHASIVLSDPHQISGRVWLRDRTTTPIDRIRIIGKRFRFYDQGKGPNADLTMFSRQIAAFGEAFQKLLHGLHVGIVGLGGTGSAVCEQLIRLGVAKLTVCDPQTFESTNINRVYGSGMSDDGTQKTHIAERQAANVGIGTVVRPLVGAATDLWVAEELKECDLIFGCTDDEWGRAVLTKMAAYYLIPVFDMGVQINSENRRIKSVRGRVTTLIPGSPCLFCRGVVTPDGIQAEVLSKTNPKEYENRRKEGYIPELPGTAPAVVMFTSTVAASAVCEMLHRFTGYMGDDRNSTEVLHRFDESKISTNSKRADEGCWCSDPTSWGGGDVVPLLDLVWIEAK
jgi:molybdopterin/thiamine biosynthesis adenylyltransferase